MTTRSLLGRTKSAFPSYVYARAANHELGVIPTT